MRISLDSGRKLVNVNKRDFVVKFKFRNYATITVRVSRLRSYLEGGERERESRFVRFSWIETPLLRRGLISS